MGSFCLRVIRSCIYERLAYWYWRVSISTNSMIGKTIRKCHNRLNILWWRAHSRLKLRWKALFVGRGRLWIIRSPWYSAYAKRWRWMPLSTEAKTDSSSMILQSKGNCLRKSPYSRCDFKWKSLLLGGWSVWLTRPPWHQFISFRWRWIPFLADTLMCHCIKESLFDQFNLWRCPHNGTYK